MFPQTLRTALGTEKVPKYLELLFLLFGPRAEATSARMLGVLAPRSRKNHKYLRAHFFVTERKQ